MVAPVRLQVGHLGGLFFRVLLDILAETVRQHGELGLAAISEHAHTALFLEAEGSICIFDPHVVVATMVVSVRH